MHHLLWYKVCFRKPLILLIAGILLCASLKAQQIYRADHDDWTYYFGLTLGYNSAYLHHTKSTRFMQNDSVLTVEPGSSGGIVMGLLATARISDRLQIRTNPQLIIGGAKYFNYSLGSRQAFEQPTVKQTLPATLVSFPVHMKLNSDRIGNFRMYLLGGLRYDMDLSSNSSARNAEDLIKLKRNDYLIETGLGFNFYLPFVTISPEIKFSRGITNMHQTDPALKYSSVIDKIQSRMIVFSLHFED